MKKMLLAALMLLVLPLTMMADAVEVDGTYYNLDTKNQTAEVTKKPNNGKYTGAIVIPDQITVDSKDYPVTAIGQSAFNNCTELTAVTLGANIKVIKNYAFYRTGITSINIPEGVEEIQYYAFYNCAQLAEVILPSTLTTIGNSAFLSCTSLTAITIPASVSSIGDGVFGGCNNLESIVVEEGNANYDSRDNCNAIIDKKYDGVLMGCKATVIPSSAKEVLYHAFYNLNSLTSISLPASVTELQPAAFEGSGLTSVTIPATVQHVYDNPFRGCQRLTSIVVEPGNQYLDSRDNCNAIIQTRTNKLLADCRTTVIPATVTQLGSYAFCSRNDLTTFELPEQIKTIENNAFQYPASAAMVKTRTPDAGS